MRIRYKIDNDQMRLRLMNYSNVIDDELIEKMKTIKKIKFNWLFNGNVDNLPNNITHLHFGREFNKPLDNLPVNLIFLELGNSFNQPLDFLPHSLKKFTIKSRKSSYIWILQASFKKPSTNTKIFSNRF